MNHCKSRTTCLSGLQLSKENIFLLTRSGRMGPLWVLSINQYLLVGFRKCAFSVSTTTMWNMFCEICSAQLYMHIVNPWRCGWSFEAWGEEFGQAHQCNFFSRTVVFMVLVRLSWSTILMLLLHFCYLLVFNLVCSSESQLVRWGRRETI